MSDTALGTVPESTGPPRGHVVLSPSQLTHEKMDRSLEGESLLSHEESSAEPTSQTCLKKAPPALG